MALEGQNFDKLIMAMLQNDTLLHGLHMYVQLRV